MGQIFSKWVSLILMSLIGSRAIGDRANV